MTDAATNATQEITSFLDHWTGALRAKDPAAYAACYTDDVRVFDGMNPPQYRGLGAWREMIDAWFSGLGTESELILKDVQILEEGDMAVVSAIAGYWGILEGTTEKQGMWCRQTDVLRRTPDGWRICHEHSSVPFDHESGQADIGMRPSGDDDGRAARP